MLTAKQQAVLDVIRSHTARHGYPPTVREIGMQLGLASSSTVHAHLAALERAGHLERDPSKPRALKLADAAHGTPDVADGRSIPLPLVGAVAAGAPILAQEHVEDVLPVPTELTRSGTSFVLKVRGDSMIGAGILDGDYVVVRTQPEAPNGQIVVAQVNDEATCKRIHVRGGRIELHSENPAYDPIIPESCTVLGVVTGVMRAL